MNNLMTDQINLFETSITEENFFPLPILDFDLVSSIFNELEDLPSEQEQTKKREIKNEQQNTNQSQTIDNFCPKSPNETELILSPNSLPLPFETKDLLTGSLFEITDNEFDLMINNRKREHCQIEPKTTLAYGIEITKIQNHNKNECNPQTTNTKETNINLNNNKNTILFLDEEELGGDLTRSQIKLLTQEQKKRRKVLQNRISAAKCYTKMKQKIVNLDITVDNLLKSKESLSNKIINAKNERLVLMLKQSRLEKEIKKLLETGQEINELKDQVIGSLCDTFQNYGTIPSQEIETTEQLTLPETVIEYEKWTKPKKKLVKNPNNRTGFAMMVVLIAITMVFSHELIFNKSTKTQTIQQFSNEAETKRQLQTFEFGKYSSKKDKYSSTRDIWIEEIDDTEYDKNRGDTTETISVHLTLSSPYSDLDHNNSKGNFRNHDKKNSSS
ncbi:basic leucine zipper 4 [Anaeramoeba flamelloides]|uniref:Basic leucine zipper 4 n=1 Tax=Anaeramoeba flamelloides TaxID=1746091 RepID=A0ABQ8YUF7_9EUKA|nr:basic leucine zipper 4 [Anaeramoeba flamelloides]